MCNKYERKELKIVYECVWPLLLLLLLLFLLLLLSPLDRQLVTIQNIYT